MSDETKEPTTTATLEGGGGGGEGGEGGGLVINTAPSLASRLNQRADLLRRIISFHASLMLASLVSERRKSMLFEKANCNFFSFFTLDP